MGLYKECDHCEKVANVQARLRHLLQSPYIAQFDKKDHRTGQYLYPIEKADDMQSFYNYVNYRNEELLANMQSHLAGMMAAATEQARIIRCRSCRWFKTDGCACVDGLPKEDDFCSFAERK